VDASADSRHPGPQRVFGLVRRIASAILVVPLVTVVVVTLVATPASAGGPTITGTGSSYAAIAINQWVAEISSLYGDSVNYSTQSSVIGLNDFAQYPQVDFGASEIGYSSGQADQSPPANFSYQYMPDIAGATCLDYNLTNQLGESITNLNLDSQVMTGIFTGAITRWNSPTIAKINPDVLLPNAPIIVVYRTDASGDNFIFSDYLFTLQPGTWNAFTTAVNQPAGAQAIWPLPPSGERSVGKYNFGNWTGENGSDNASNYVYQNEGSITYVETGYALLHHDPCAAVANASGTYVQPSEDGDAIALQNDQLQSDLEQTLAPVFESPQYGAYPISAYSYLIMAEQSEISTAKQAVEAQFVQFLACTGQVAAGKLGYSPLPPNLVQADFDAVQRLDGVSLPAPTASNCKDPYVTGSFSAAPPPAISATATTAPSGAPGSAAASSPVATMPASGGGPVSTGGGASQSTVSHGSGPSTAQIPSATSTMAKAAAEAAAHRAHAKKAAVAAAPSGQIPGLAMTTATTQLLGLRGPSAVPVLATVVLLAILAAPPIVAGLRRRRRAAEPETDDA
jgi:phosphate transport system substrate-binding protein